MITDPFFFLVAIPAVMIAGISKGGFGSGLGIMATPLIALAIPTPQAAAIMLPILMVMDVTGLVAYRGTFHRANLGLLLVGGVLGIALGALTFRFFSEAMIRTMLGVIALAFVVQRHLQGGTQAPALVPSRAKGLAWSVVSGLTSTIAHAGGPPLSMYLLPLKLDKAVLVGTTVIFFAVINAVKVVPYFWLGLFDAKNLLTSAALVPLAPVGIVTGVWLMRRMSQVFFYRIAYTMLAIVGVKLLWDGVRGLAA